MRRQANALACLWKSQYLGKRCSLAPALPLLRVVPFWFRQGRGPLLRALTLLAPLLAQVGHSHLPLPPLHLLCARAAARRAEFQQPSLWHRRVSRRLCQAREQRWEQMRELVLRIDRTAVASLAR